MELVGRVDRLLTRDRLTVYPAIALVAFALTVLAPWLSGSAPLLPDFVARWTAGRLVVQGNTDAIYDPAAQSAIQMAEQGLGDSISLFVSPPFVALICAPFGALPYLLAAILWSALSVAAFGLSFALLKREFADRDSPWHRKGAILAVMATYPVIELFGGGQDTGFVLLAAVTGLRLLNSSREWLAGLVLAGTLIKPHLVFLLPIVLIMPRRRIEPLVWLALTSSAVVGATSVVLGVGTWSNWLGVLLSDTYSAAVHAGQAWKSASLNGLVAATTDSSRVWVAVTLALAGAAAVAVWGIVRKSSVSFTTAWAMAMAASVLTSPHAMIYDVVLLLPMVFAITNAAWTPVSRVLLLAWTLAMFLVAPLFVLKSALSLPAALIAPWHVLIACALFVLLARAVQTPPPHLSTKDRQAG